MYMLLPDLKLIVEILSDEDEKSTIDSVRFPFITNAVPKMYAYALFLITDFRLKIL